MPNSRYRQTTSAAMLQANCVPPDTARQQLGITQARLARCVRLLGVLFPDKTLEVRKGGWPWYDQDGLAALEVWLTMPKGWYVRPAPAGWTNANQDAALKELRKLDAELAEKLTTSLSALSDYAGRPLELCLDRDTAAELAGCSWSTLYLNRRGPRLTRVPVLSPDRSDSAGQAVQGPHGAQHHIGYRFAYTLSQFWQWRQDLMADNGDGTFTRPEGKRINLHVAAKLIGFSYVSLCCLLDFSRQPKRRRPSKWLFPISQPVLTEETTATGAQGRTMLEADAVALRDAIDQALRRGEELTAQGYCDCQALAEAVGAPLPTAKRHKPLTAEERKAVRQSQDVYSHAACWAELTDKNHATIRLPHAWVLRRVTGTAMQPRGRDKGKRHKVEKLVWVHVYHKAGFLMLWRRDYLKQGKRRILELVPQEQEVSAHQVNETLRTELGIVGCRLQEVRKAAKVHSCQRLGEGGRCQVYRRSKRPWQDSEIEEIVKSFFVGGRFPAKEGLRKAAEAGLGRQAYYRTVAKIATLDRVVIGQPWTYTLKALAPANKPSADSQYPGHARRPHGHGPWPDPARETVLQFCYDEYVIQGRPAGDVLRDAQQSFGARYAPKTTAHVRAFARQWASRWLPPLPLR
jgi:hypothetical protein